MKMQTFKLLSRLIAATVLICGASAAAPAQEAELDVRLDTTLIDDVDPPAPTASVDFADAIEKAGQGIVQIRRTSNGVGNGDGGYGAGHGDGGYGKAGFSDAAETVSTGVIVGTRHVLTVESSIDDNEQVQIVQADGQLLDARLIARDPVTMTVVLEVDQDLQGTVLQRDASPPRPGTPLAAVWAREAPRLVAAAGIVATEPYWHSAMQLEAFETTAVVHPGSVGGALIGSDGRLRGIVVGMESRTLDAGPAIALHIARLDRVLQTVQERDAQQPVVKLERGVLGVTLSDHRGTHVERVAVDSPAAAAGIKPFDKITGIDGQRVDGSADLFRHLSGYRSGDEVTVQLQRDEESLAVDLQLQPAPVQRDVPERREMRMRSGAAPWLPRVIWKNDGVLVPAPPAGVPALDPARLPPNAAIQVVPHLRVERTDLEQSIQSLHKEIRQLRQQLEKMQSAHAPEE